MQMPSPSASYTGILRTKLRKRVTLLSGEPHRANQRSPDSLFLLNEHARILRQHRARKCSEVMEFLHETWLAKNPIQVLIDFLDNGRRRLGRRRQYKPADRF